MAGVRLWSAVACHRYDSPSRRRGIQRDYQSGDRSPHSTSCRNSKMIVSACSHTRKS